MYEGLQELRSSCDAAVGGLAAAKEALLAGFNQWAEQQAFGRAAQVRWTVGRDCGSGVGAVAQRLSARCPAHTTQLGAPVLG